MLTDEEKRNEVLNWITGHQHVDGVYLIFENNFFCFLQKDSIEKNFNLACQLLCLIDIYYKLTYVLLTYL